METLTFPEKLAPLVESVGVERAGAICGVHPRTIQNWLGSLHLPNKSTQAGAIMLLQCHQETQPEVADLP